MKTMYDTLIQASELSAHLDDKNWLIFDCRFDLADSAKGEALYRESHIPGAIYAHLDKHLSSAITVQSGRHPLPDITLLVNWLAACGLTEQSQVVVYDDSYGAMASRLWWLLKCLGHSAVALVDGGWQAWQAASLALDDRPAVLQPSDYSAELDCGCYVSTEEVIDNLQSNDFQLIDVRTSERFSGKAEPIDPIAGHIPGSINIPLSENLDPGGLFKSAAELQQLYAGSCSDGLSQQPVFMCGSGVTACHSVFATVLAGFSMPRVYAGSWSEWIRDVARPVATGLE